jgi:hypothetical protein
MSDHDRGQCAPCRHEAEMVQAFFDRVEKDLFRSHEMQADASNQDRRLYNHLRTTMFLLSELFDLTLERYELPLTVVVDIFGREIARRTGLQFVLSEDKGVPTEALPERPAFGPSGKVN